MRKGTETILTGSLLLCCAVASAGGVMAPSQTLEALQAQAVQAPELSGRGEDASANAGAGFQGSVPFHIKSLTPVDYVATDAVRRTEVPVAETPAPARSQPLAIPPAEVPPQDGAPQRSPTNNYYFEGSSPVSGITIYRTRPDLSGDGSTGSEPQANPLAKYGKWGLIGGAALIVGAFLLGGPWGIALGVLGGAALAVGGLISFLFGRRR